MRKGQGKNEKKTKGRKKDKGFNLILHLSKIIKKIQEKTKNIKGIPLGFYARWNDYSHFSFL